MASCRRVDDLEAVYIDEVRNTQLTISGVIENRGEQVKLVPWAANLVLEEWKFGDRKCEIPPIRIARNPESGVWYSCDNRRLFVLKALGFEGAILGRVAQESHWTREFKIKMGGRGKHRAYHTNSKKEMERFRCDVLHYVIANMEPRLPALQHRVAPALKFSRAATRFISVYLEIFNSFDNDHDQSTIRQFVIDKLSSVFLFFWDESETETNSRDHNARTTIESQ